MILLGFFAAFILTAALIPLSIGLSKKYRAIDKPGERKVHKKNIYRLGGVAIFGSFFITFALYVLPSSNPLLFFKIFFPCALIFLAGFLDDIYTLKPSYKLLLQFLAAVIAVWLGLEITSFMLPGFGQITLSQTLLSGISLGGISALIWLIFLTNVVNLSDGLDGLAAGLVGIAALFLALLSFFNLQQYFLAGIFAILAGASFGFLPFNFYPAKIFMGDSGAMFLGFVLGILSILSGAKILTALLVIGFPILDLGWSVLRRFSRHGLKGIFRADREHIHHLLLDAGMSQRQVVIFFYAISIAFGTFALFGDTQTKLLAFVLLTLLTIGVIGIAILWLRRGKRISET